MVRWNLRKTYLGDLRDHGVPIVPTVFVAPGQPWSLESTLVERRWGEAVVKPTVSLSAHRTYRCNSENAGEVQALVERGSDHGYMVQPYVDEIADGGEWSLVYFLGQYSHTCRKRPAPGDFRVQREHGGSRAIAEPPPEVRVAAERVVEVCAATCLYARIDGVLSGDTWQVMEVELIDPELYLDTGETVERFADAIEAALGR